ncbi:MAG: tyrosine-protein phosphatase [Oscillospiraceae bacterium]|nr:tyrosine-protein phosphatase [Oscillospiraceae bacterium]
MATENISCKISFEGLNNTRDLGGMRTKQGQHILPGKLIRSGQLHSATEKDISVLSVDLALVVDFRTEQERVEKPDPYMAGVINLHLPVFESLAAGVTREEKSDAEAFAMVSSDPQKACQYMLETYIGFVTNDFSVSQYSKFVRLLLEPRDKAVLWHCTAGKDRAGFASVIVQELLGVGRDDIFADYLKTNEYLKTEVGRLLEIFGQNMGAPDEKTTKSLDYLFGAHEEYLAGIYEKVEELYGGFDSFLTDGLKICPDEIERFRRMYLAD